MEMLDQKIQNVQPVNVERIVVDMAVSDNIQNIKVCVVSRR